MKTKSKHEFEKIVWQYHFSNYSFSKQTLSKVDKIVSMSTRVTRDETDGGNTNLVFDE